jgi:uncharacterized MnhB-related membrane protein
VTALQVVGIVLCALGGTSLVLVRDPLRQALVSSVYGLGLVVLFVVFQAPDVSLSALVVSSLAFPLMLLLTLAKVRNRRDR